MDALGRLYAGGRGVARKDVAEAARWYRKAADGGNPSGMAHLAAAYETGAGVARDDGGAANGSMGADVCDYDGTLRPSVWCVNYEHEKHALYHNDSSGDRVVFRYATEAAGIAAIGLAYVGWGTHFLDMDLDGWVDIFIVNGHALRFPTGKAKRAQRPVLFRNQGQGRFKEATAQGGPYCQTNHVGRGAAFGDLDNDGRIDVVISNVNEPVALLRGVGGAVDCEACPRQRLEDRRQRTVRIEIVGPGEAAAQGQDGVGNDEGFVDPRAQFAPGIGGVA